jgi:GNAT superfamily N-acetyltransferase
MSLLLAPPSVGTGIDVSYAVRGANVSVLRRLVGECLRSVHSDSRPWSEQDAELLASLPGAYVPDRGGALIATIDRVPAGCVLLRPAPDRRATPEITKLYVRPRFRRRGVAGALIHEAATLACAIGHGTVHLTVAGDNVAALSLFQKLGFCDVTSKGVPLGLMSEPVPTGGRVMVGDALEVSASSHSLRAAS